MSKLQAFRAVVNEQLAAVAQEISALFERTIAEYEDEIRRSKEENQKKQQLLDIFLNPTIPLLRVDTGPRLNQGHLTEISQIKEEPEEQSSVTHEEVQLPAPIPRSSAVCVKIEEFSLPQKRQQTKHREEPQGEDVSSEPHFHSETERPTEHSSETDNYEDWAAPMEAEADGDQCNQVQTSDRSTKLYPQNKAAPQTSVKSGQTSATDGGAKRKKHLGSVRQKSLGRKGTLQNHTQIHTVLNPRILLLRVDTGPRLNQGHLTEIPQIKDHPEEQRSVTHEEVQLPVPILRSSAVCVKTKEFSLPQKQQTKHREETQGEDISSEPHFHSETERPTEHSSETENYEDWAAPMEAEADGDQCNQVQTSDRSTKLYPQNKAAPQTSVKSGQTSATDGGAKRKKHLGSVRQKSLGRKGTLQNHTQIHTGEKPHSCSVCKKTFVSKGNLHKHKITHTGEKPHSCSVCKKTFAFKCHLVTHKRTHTGDKPHSCSVCKKTFAFKGNLVAHKRTHTGDKPYSCPVCKRTFAFKCGLVTHKRTHTGEKPYSCSVCKKTFAQIGNLASHKRTHTGDKPYSCPVCNKTFAFKYGLVTHKRTHTGEKPYSCPVCKRTFAFKCGLVIHKRTHTGEKPYSCPVCKKTFAQIANLASHKRTHTGDKPYSCHLCSKAFSQQPHLKRHISTHRGQGSE